MLTKTDISQIEKVVALKTKNLATRDDLKGFATRDDLAGQLKPIKTDLAKIRKDVDVIISMFDREYVELRKRVDRIEEHLRLPPLSQ